MKAQIATVALLLGCARSGETSAAAPGAPSVAGTATPEVAPGDRAVCAALSQRDAPSSVRWRDALRGLEIGGYLFVLDAPAPIDARVTKAIDELGLMDVQTTRCAGALVVWVPAQNLSLEAAMEDAIAGKTGARVREKAIVAPKPITPRAP